MGLVTVAPDAILASTNYGAAPLVATIQDDPDAADALWITAANVNEPATTMRVSFPTPAGGFLTTGQEFRVLLRKVGGSNTPVVSLWLYVAGTPIAESGGISVTSTAGQVLSFTWDGTDRAVADIEFHFEVAGQTGAGAKKSTVEVGAVEWNAVTTSVVTHQGAGAWVSSSIWSASASRSAGASASWSSVSAWSATLPAPILPAYDVWRGVNAFGGDSGSPSFEATSTFSNTNVGTYGSNWLYDRLDSLKFYAGRGHKSIRVPFRWERLQPTLGAAFNAAEMGRLQALLDNANTAGVKIILDPHNYGAYYLSDGTQGVRRVIGSAEVTTAHWQDFWTRMVTAFGAKPALLAYDLMNEPTGYAAVDGVFSSNLTRHEFAALTGEDAFYTTVGSTVSQATWQTASTLKGTRTFANGAYDQLEMYGPDKSVSTDVSASGLVFRFRVWIDSTLKTGWEAKLNIELGTGYIGGPNKVLVADAWNDVDFTLTAAQAADFRKVMLQVHHGNAAGAVVNAYVDYVQQGSYTGAGAKTESKVWEEIAQTGYNAIRTAEGAGTKKHVLIPTYAYSNAYRVDLLHPNGPWIAKVSGEDKLIYEVHHYWDNLAGAGTATYDQEVTNALNGNTPRGISYAAGANADALITRIRAEAQTFKNWLGTEKGYVGEYGIPSSTVPVAETAQWVALADIVLGDYDAHKFWATAWAAGEFWQSTNFRFSAFYTNVPESGAMNTVNIANVANVIETHPSLESTTDKAGGASWSSTSAWVATALKTKFGTATWTGVSTWAANALKIKLGTATWTSLSSWSATATSGAAVTATWGSTTVWSAAAIKTKLTTAAWASASAFSAGAIVIEFGSATWTSTATWSASAASLGQVSGTAAWTSTSTWVVSAGGTGDFEGFDTLPADIIKTAGVTLDNGTLRSDGDGEWWYFNGTRFQVTGDFDITYDVQFPDPGATRDIANFAFWINPGATPTTTANGFMFRLDTGNAGAVFLKVTGGTHTILSGGTNNLGTAMDVAPRGPVLRTRLVAVGTIVRVTTIQLDTNVLIRDYTLDFATLFDPNSHPRSGTFGQKQDGAGSAAGHRWDNIQLGGAGVERTAVASAAWSSVSVWSATVSASTTHAGTASWTSVAVWSSSATVTRLATAAWIGTSTWTASGVRALFGSATWTSSATWTAVAVVTEIGSATWTSTSAWSATAIETNLATASWTSASAWSATDVRTQFASAVWTSGSTWSASAVVTEFGSAAWTSASTWSGVGTITAFAGAAWTSITVWSASAAGGGAASAFWISTNSWSSTATQTFQAGATWISATVWSAGGIRISNATAAWTTASVWSASATRVVVLSATWTSQTIWSSTAIQSVFASAVWISSASWLAISAGERFADAVWTSTSTWTATGTRAIDGSAAWVSVTAFNAGAVRIRPITAAWISTSVWIAVAAENRIFVRVNGVMVKAIVKIRRSWQDPFVKARVMARPIGTIGFIQVQAK